MNKETLSFVTPPAEKLQNFFGVFLQFQIGVDTGESQRKDGRYTYKYTDSTGKPQFVYASKPVATDKTPAGKRDDISLPDDPLGGKSIDAVKPSDAKGRAIRMREKGFSFQSISNYKRSLRAAFFIAIEDDGVRKTPFSFALNKVLEDDRGEKTVLTPEQEVSLIDFAQNDPVYQKYADELIILLGTGLRISEFRGLTTNLDLKNRLIRVDHQLLRDSENGYREIPMSEPVYRALKRVVKNRGEESHYYGGRVHQLPVSQKGRDAESGHEL